ncbi:MAG TPA: hypothetical protein PKN33_18960 [Phycisphaerae bacterium]|nr:hypothetical protein [Phycisphaerae bacterium]
MNTDSNEREVPDVEATQTVGDDGLVCLKCDYNLTGIDSERCPECGCVLDRDEIRRVMSLRYDRPLPHWERYHGLRKPLGFLITTLRLIFLPWRFAQDLPTVPRIKPAAWFVAVCMAVSVGLGGLTSAPDLGAFVSWYTGVACHIMMQVAILGFLLPPEPLRHGYRFWLVVSLYTTYPIMTEVLAEPPYIVSGYSSIWPFNGGGNQHNVFSTLHYYVWWIGLIAIASMRVSKRRRKLIPLMFVAIPMMTYVSTYAGCQVSELF